MTVVPPGHSIYLIITETPESTRWVNDLQCNNRIFGFLARHACGNVGKNSGILVLFGSLCDI